jgi:hypothetical protein
MPPFLHWLFGRQDSTTNDTLKRILKATEKIAGDTAKIRKMREQRNFMEDLLLPRPSLEDDDASGKDR